MAGKRWNIVSLEGLAARVDFAVCPFAGRRYQNRPEIHVSYDHIWPAAPALHLLQHMQRLL